VSGWISDGTQLSKFRELHVFDMSVSVSGGGWDPCVELFATDTDNAR
jgi:hypothetical protein